jgi:hypothetical protein
MDIAERLVCCHFAVTTVRRATVVVRVGVLGNDLRQDAFVYVSRREICLAEIRRLV